MKIGELSRLTGVATSAIRFYESRGLLQTASRQANGYRDYPRETVAVLTIISHAQQAGFSLDEIKRLLPADITSWQHDELVGTLQHKLADIEALQMRLTENKERIQALLRLIESRPDDMDCKLNASRIMASMGIPDAGQPT